MDSGVLWLRHWKLLYNDWLSVHQLRYMPRVFFCRLLRVVCACTMCALVASFFCLCLHLLPLIYNQLEKFKSNTDVAIRSWREFDWVWMFYYPISFFRLFLFVYYMSIFFRHLNGWNSEGRYGWSSYRFYITHHGFSSFIYMRRMVSPWISYTFSNSLQLCAI